MFVDLLLLLLVSYVLYPNRAQVHTEFGYINLNVFSFIPLSLVFNADSILSRSPMLRRFIFLGFVLGLITPPLDLLYTWFPALIERFGILLDSAVKLYLEDFSENLDSCIHSILPTAVFGAFIWALIYAFNNMLIWLYCEKYMPAAKRVTKPSK